jgi:hypothetical protein
MPPHGPQPEPPRRRALRARAARATVPEVTEVVDGERTSRARAPPSSSEFFAEAVALTDDAAFIADNGNWIGAQPEGPFGFVIPCALVNPPWSYVDAALAGAAGEPQLFGAGTLVAGDPLVVSLAKAAPVAAGLLVAGASVVDLPAFGGVLVPSPDRVFAFATDAAGALLLTADWPAGVPPGFALHVQAWIHDAGGPQGWAASNALSLVTP